MAEIMIDSFTEVVILQVALKDRDPESIFQRTADPLAIWRHTSGEFF